jgi:Response regulators consisting of a CheY-like receiver domain and a winged-helix DNA-binding domain
VINIEEKKKILIVDDEKNICELLALYLEKEGYDTECAFDGKTALEKFYEYKPDLVLLDLMLPIVDGWEVCREIRKSSSCPVIILTAKGEVFDKVAGLEMGADDYIVKPFEPKEVVARIKAIFRRVNLLKENSAENELKFPDLSINFTTYELKVLGKKIDTPPKEMELLYFLAENPNKVFTRDVLLDKIWGYEYFGYSRTVDVHIKRLREKLEGVSTKWRLKTVWGVGYKFEVDE